MCTHDRYLGTMNLLSTCVYQQSVDSRGFIMRDCLKCGFKENLSAVKFVN